MAYADCQRQTVSPPRFVRALSGTSFSRAVVLPPVEYGAALPFQVKFLFLGAASYFLYKHRAAHSLANTAFPVAYCLALFLFG